MKELSLQLCQEISGGVGRFRVVVFAAVSPACALFVSGLYEQVLVGKLTKNAFYRAMLDSPYSRDELEAALTGLEVLHWPLNT